MALLDAQGGEVQEEAEALIGYAKSRDVDLGKRKSAEGHRLVHLLDGNVSEWRFLLLTAMQVDRRTRLYKRFQENRAGPFFRFGRARSGKIHPGSLFEVGRPRLRP